MMFFQMQCQFTFSYTSTMGHKSTTIKFWLKLNFVAKCSCTQISYSHYYKSSEIKLGSRKQEWWRKPAQGAYTYKDEFELFHKYSANNEHQLISSLNFDPWTNRMQYILLKRISQSQQMIHPYIWIFKSEIPAFENLRATPFYRFI